MLRVIVTSIVLFFISQSVACGKICISTKKLDFLFYNFLAIFCIYSFLNIFLWNYQINFLIVISIFFLLSLTMYYVHEFRGTNINFSDILSINTAKEVASGYKYRVKPIFIFVSVIIIFEYIIHIAYFKIDIFENYFKGINGVNGNNILVFRLLLHEITQIILFFVSFFLLKDKISSTKYDYSLFAGENEGYIYNFISSIPIFSKADSEDDNSAIEDFINYIKYRGDDEENTENAQNNDIIDLESEDYPVVDMEDYPHVIVIMNESFGFAQDFVSTNIEVTPYYNSLDGVTKGNLYVNTFGGGTANTEFEFLTCMTIGNYEYPVMPYNNFVKSDKYSLARLFDNLGYKTIAMHPYTATNYHRDVVYKRFGFDELLFFDDFKNKEYVRSFVSDKSMYDEVIRRYEMVKNSNEKMFLFGITMQNHSGYSDFDGKSISTNIKADDKESIDSYLSLMKISDNAIKTLIDYFKNESERVVILFFGDHNASFGTEINKLVYENKCEYECTNAYRTPFFICDNMSSESNYIESISANFLSIELLKKANLPMDAMHLLANKVYKEYSTYNYHKMLSKKDNKLYDIKNDLYMKLEKGYLK